MDEMSEYERGYIDGMSAQIKMNLNENQEDGDIISISGTKYISFKKYDELIRLYYMFISVVSEQSQCGYIEKTTEFYNSIVNNK